MRLSVRGLPLTLESTGNEASAQLTITRSCHYRPRDLLAGVPSHVPCRLGILAGIRPMCEPSHLGGGTIRGDRKPPLRRESRKTTTSYISSLLPPGILPIEFSVITIHNSPSYRSCGMQMM